MRIGQVAKLSGLSTRTIDYYTSNKLLPVTRSASNYRLYSEDVLHTLERIKLLKKQRMSIEEIRKVIQSTEDEDIEPIMNEVQAEIACLQKKLTSLEEKLKDAPQEEKKKVYRTLETKLLDVMKLLSLM
ncbi:MerR family transcriptional regulator [Cytobacillus oceanisediminis]|uniref:MerR family transcriptional regulator n=1 Tax=Niallia circulans TaxID=1397 RepID=A0A941GFE1_NIACI|nr:MULTISPECIES: MerR family transcriptional regulator [Bacillaceae]EOR24118.1 MerR family transcriptional regulator [Niallia nealsonii AAU1]MDU1846059.1 MerR family transcriptional regulator [Niallia nealsonii]MBZ9532897.1 MerR family transcriptional regulator [Cytobacillus oceanisediminis]MCB5236282.1 MerR family transcriptional regulator [Niallia circulans]MED3793345.1 MerR family transcriptional regulator [Niallia alba]